MRKLAGTVALGLALTACGGDGGNPQGAATTAPPTTPSTSPTPTLDPEVEQVRGLVEKSLGRCPCDVSVDVTTDKGYTWVGYHDPADGGTSTLHDAEGPKLQLVIVAGATFFTSPAVKEQGRGYVRLDFSGVPRTTKLSYWTALAPLDPTLALSLARNVSEVTETHTAGKRVTHDVEFDVSAVSLPGDSGALLSRLVTDANSIGQVIFIDGALSEVKFHAAGKGGSMNETVDVRLVLRKYGVPGKDVKVPSSDGVLDVTQM